MNKYLRRTTLSLAIALAAGCAQAATTEYYRHLIFRESPYENIRGNYPIKKAEADQSMHFRLVRDDQGRLIEVSQRIGDKLVSATGSWEGFFWFAPMLKIQYQEGQEIRQFYGVQGKQIAAHGQVYEQRFQLDKNGKRQSLSFFDKDGKPVDSEWAIQRYEWQAQADGSVIENRYNLKNEVQTLRPEFHFQRVRMVFGNDDLLDFVFNIDESGALVENETGAAVDRIVYDHNENFVRWQVYNKNRQLINGNDPGVAIGEHLYDTLGNKIGLRGFDTDGSDRALYGGNFTSEYNHFGNIIRASVADQNGKLLQDVRFTYSPDGLRRLDVKFIDDKSQLVNGPDGFALAEYVYDENLRQTGVKRFDAQRQELK